MEPEPEALEYLSDPQTEPIIETRPVADGRQLKRSNAIALINIPSQVEKGTRNKAKVAEPEPDSGELSAVDWEMIDETPNAKKKPTKPKTRDLIKAASERKALVEHDLEDNMMEVSKSTTFCLQT